jgi:DNA polymerase-3 subunit gamma/tau
MSYLALARKWRPRQFADVLGQAPVVQALSHALDQDRLHPAILLTGTRGVGKTTLARIVAKGLNCDTGVSAQPCGVCSSCREIDEGRSVDMLEIDAASNTGVDNIREIIENSQYAPARSRYKVYLVDEVHMLSKGAFNALLKTLEEPPPHVKFVLATTDPQKLPATVLSRCLQFGLRRLPVALIREQLSRIAEAEGITAETGALLAIARAADGSMRDGLSLLDQAIAFAGGAALGTEAVDSLLGTGSRRVLWPLLQALFADDRAALAACLDRLATQAPDYAALLEELATVLQRIALLQLLPGSESEEDEAELLALREAVAPEDLQLYYQIAIGGRRDLPWSPEPRLAFEMSVLRMLAFRPAGEGEPLRPARSGAVPAEAATAGRSIAAAASPALPAAAATPPAPGVDDWARQIDAMGLEAFTRGLARNCALREEGESEVRLLLEAKAQHLLTEPRRQALEAALSQLRGRALRLQIDVSEATVPDCPARQEADAEAARQQAAEASLRDDPAVRALQQQFGASLRPGSVQVMPPSPSRRPH